MRPYPRGFYPLLLLLLLLLAGSGLWAAIPVLAERFEQDVYLNAPMGLLMQLHGAAAMLFVLGLGALLPMHVRMGLLRQKNHGSGIALLGLNLLLLISAWGLYYLGGETTRRLASDTHLISAVLLLLNLGQHLRLAYQLKRQRRSSH